MSWYYARGEERMGPIEDEELSQLVSSGVVTPQTLVWQEGMADWQPYGSVAAITTGGDEIPPSIFGEQTVDECAECGRSFPSDDMVAYEQYRVCGGCKDVFFQRIREGGGALSDMRFGGFWIRFCARIVDGFILGFVGILQNLAQVALTGGAGFDPARQMTSTDIAVFVISYFVGIGIAIAYEVYFIGRYAATPGKMVFGLKVVMSDGGRVSYLRATGRYFATWLSTMTLMIGYIIAAFDREKRSLHDHICDTRVIRK